MELTSNIAEALNLFSNPNLHDFVKDVIEEFGTQEKAEKAAKVTLWCKNILEHYNLISHSVEQTFIDVMYTSAMIHNVFYDPNDLTTLLKARAVLWDHELMADIPETYKNAILEGIEFQLGQRAPTASLRPNRDTPQAIIALAIFIVDKLEQE